MNSNLGFVMPTESGDSKIIYRLDLGSLYQVGLGESHVCGRKRGDRLGHTAGSAEGARRNQVVTLACTAI
jgi:hypothetical protein